MGYRAEHFYYETRKKGRTEKLAGQGIHHEFVQEGNRFVNKLFTELCLAKSCFISLIYLSKRI